MSEALNVWRLMWNNDYSGMYWLELGLVAILTIMIATAPSFETRIRTRLCFALGIIIAGFAIIGSKEYERTWYARNDWNSPDCVNDFGAALPAHCHVDSLPDSMFAAVLVIHLIVPVLIFGLLVMLIRRLQHKWSQRKVRVVQ